MEIKENIILAPYTTYKIGGKARFFTICNSKKDIIEALEYAKEHELKYLILGSGSNVLFQDEGYFGLIILNRYNEISFNNNLITCGSGTILSLLIKQALARDLGGMENLFGIPGTVGGAIYQNAGAYGSEIAEFLIEATIINENGEIQKVGKDYFEFGYRDSILKRKNEIVLEVTLELTAINKTKNKENLEKITASRSKTKPYGRSCGSFFKNPSKEYSAGKLIEEVGLKGFIFKNTVVSPEHANYLINKCNSSSKDLLELAKLIKDKVLKEKNITLEEEVQIISP